MTTVVAGRVLNHKPDSWAVARAQRNAKALLAAGPQSFTPHLARPHVLSILNQLQLGSCTGHAIVQALRALQHLLGLAAPPLVSRLWTYYLGRWFQHDTANDDGAMIGNDVLGLEMYGLCPETIWPYSDDTDPKNPLGFRGPAPPDAWRAAYDTIKWLAAHRINSAGDQLLDDVRAALTQGRLVVFGSAVSEAFCHGSFDATKPLLPPSDADIAGLHAECVGDFDLAGNFDIVNSWGEDFGNAGWWKATPDYLLDKNSSDFYVFDRAPTTAVVDPA